MNYFVLASLPVEATTVFSDGSTTGYIFDLFLSFTKDFIALLRNFKIWGNVSYFDFFIALAVMSIVIVYLLNIARSPGVETTSGQFARKDRAERNRRMEEFKKSEYKEYLNKNHNAYKEYLSNRDKK